MESKSLSHVGVLGMRWGHRKAKSVSVPSSDHLESRSLKKKKLHELSNAEITKINNRLQLEKTLKELDRFKSDRGRKIVEDVLSEQGKKILTGIAAAGIALATPYVKKFVVTAFKTARERMIKG